MTRFRQFVKVPRLAIGGVVASAMLVGSLGVAVPSGSASSVKWAASSAFCKTLVSLEKVKPPSATNYKTYRAWAKTYLPYYTKLAAQAPSSAKGVLTELVTILKYESNAASAIKLESYVATHTKQWTNGWKAFTTAAVSCVSQMYG
jgi:hypothetical protein